MEIELKPDVEPDITADTSFDEVVEIPQKREGMAHSTELSCTMNQYTNAVSNAVTQPGSKDRRNNT